MQLRTGSFCSGIAAPEFAWTTLGWRSRWFSEIEPFASSVLSHRFADIPNLGDMEKINGKELEPVDVVCAGTPCQSFSVAGLRKGMADPRGNLALILLRLVDSIRPKWLVWENVPGVLSSSEGRDFGAFLGALGQLGYGWAYRVLDAQYLGVPQRRRRVFVVGHLGDWRRAAAVLFERHSLSWDSPPSRETRARIARSLKGGTRGGGGQCSSDEQETLEDGTVRGTPIIPIDMRQASRGATMTNNRRAGAASGGAPGTGIGQAGDPCPSLADSHTPAIAIQERAVSENPANGPQGKGWQENLAFTLEARHHSQAVQAVRRLTPRECERLQGFPDDWTLIQYRGKPASDGPRYRAIGNSMAVPVLLWIGKRIEAVEAIGAHRPRDVRPVQHLVAFPVAEDRREPVSRVLLGTLRMRWELDV